MTAFFHWLGTPFRAVRGWFPFTHDGRQTLIYIIFAGAGPTLTLIVWWAMNALFAAKQWDSGVSLAQKIAWALLIIVSGLACFVSIRAISLGKDGLGITGWRDRDEATRAADKVATAAVDKATEIKESVKEGTTS